MKSWVEFWPALDRLEAQNAAGVYDEAGWSRIREWLQKNQRARWAAAGVLTEPGQETIEEAIRGIRADVHRIADAMERPKMPSSSA